MKPLSATAETRIRTKITKLGKNQGKNWGKSRLNSILMLHDCVYERLTLKVILRYGSCKLIKSFDCKLPLWCFLTEKWQLRCIETPMIYSVFGGRLGLLQFLDCMRGIAHGLDYGLEYFGGPCSEVCREKNDGFRSKQSTDVI